MDCGQIVVPGPAIVATNQARLRQERDQVALHRHGTGARAAAAVGRGKRLVQIQVHDVGAEIARTRDADQRVHVGAIHIELRALGMQDFGDARNVLFEDAQRVGICQHQRGDVFVDGARQFIHVHHAQRVGLDVFHRIACHSGGCWIGAMGRIGDQQLLAGMALRFQQRPDHQDSSELSVRARGGLQCHRIHAGDLGEHLFQRRHHFHDSLR